MDRCTDLGAHADADAMEKCNETALHYYAAENRHLDIICIHILANANRTIVVSLE